MGFFVWDFLYMLFPTVRARRGRLSTLAFSYVNRFCMEFLYGRTGRLRAKNGGFRPGQPDRDATYLAHHIGGLLVLVPPRIYGSGCVVGILCIACGEISRGRVCH